MPDRLALIAQTEMNDAYRDFDPRDPDHAAELHRVADVLADAEPPLMATADPGSVEGLDEVPLLAELAAKLARSKVAIRALERPVHVSVVFAVYKEHTRMLRPDRHPHGEDCVVRKVEQMRWLFDGVEFVSWELLIVDDGCPHGSGRLAEEILRKRCPDAPAHVLFLEDAVRDRLPIAEGLATTSDSQKGGSVLYGMWIAAEERRDRQIVVFTDADLSVNLGQTGLLVDEIIRAGADAAVGSRREPGSVVIKTGHRNTRGKLFIYLWKGLIRPLRDITDTQCGFKAFPAETLREILADLIERRFAFDIELLLKTELRRAGSIRKVPIAWIDSDAASTTTDLEPYLPMLRSVVAMYRRHLAADPDADRLADLIESMTDAEWAHLSEHVPEPIAEGDPTTFDRDREVTVEHLTRAMRAGPGPG